MKTILIYHDDAQINKVGLAPWLASFSDLVGLVVLKENFGQKYRRVKREVKRSGYFRFLDILIMRLYYNLFLKKRDTQIIQQLLRKLRNKYLNIPSETPILYTNSPNTKEAEKFIQEIKPDLMIARCKFIIKERVFRIPQKGTFIFHPGICPEYRNAYGCFWALANDDLKNVGMTLLKIDKGVDTGPVFGYYSYKFNELEESHITIMARVVLENLEDLKEKLLEIYNNKAKRLDTSSRKSKMWGQPWFSHYVRWRFRARRRAKDESHIVRIS